MSFHPTQSSGSFGSSGSSGHSGPKIFPPSARGNLSSGSGGHTSVPRSAPTTAKPPSTSYFNAQKPPMPAAATPSYSSHDDKQKYFGDRSERSDGRERSDKYDRSDRRSFEDDYDDYEYEDEYDDDDDDEFETSMVGKHKTAATEPEKSGLFSKYRNIIVTVVVLILLIVVGFLLFKWWQKRGTPKNSPDQSTKMNPSYLLGMGLGTPSGADTNAGIPSEATNLQAFAQQFNVYMQRMEVENKRRDEEISKLSAGMKRLMDNVIQAMQRNKFGGIQQNGQLPNSYAAYLPNINSPSNGMNGVNTPNPQPIAREIQTSVSEGGAPMPKSLSSNRRR